MLTRSFLLSGTKLLTSIRLSKLLRHRIPLSQPSSNSTLTAFSEFSVFLCTEKLSRFLQHRAQVSGAGRLWSSRGGAIKVLRFSGGRIVAKRNRERQLRAAATS
ncbi:hypothetical protein Droror1_Dr00025664 [Drosera rotundifolia]